jgi:hypothetical protein
MVIPKIIDHDGQARLVRGTLRGQDNGQRRNNVYRLRPPTPEYVVETLQAGCSGSSDTMQVMNVGNAGEFFIDRIMCGPVRIARAGKRNRDVDVVGRKGLGFARLARGKLGAHPDFGSSAAGIPRGDNEFTADGSDLSGGRRGGFFATNHTG